MVDWFSWWNSRIWLQYGLTSTFSPEMLKALQCKHQNNSWERDQLSYRWGRRFWWQIFINQPDCPNFCRDTVKGGKRFSSPIENCGNRAETDPVKSSRSGWPAGANRLRRFPGRSEAAQTSPESSQCNEDSVSDQGYFSIIFSVPISEDLLELPKHGFASALAVQWPHSHFSLVSADRNWVGPSRWISCVAGWKFVLNSIVWYIFKLMLKVSPVHFQSNPRLGPRRYSKVSKLNYRT